jgi:hypothetical protein
MHVRIGIVAKIIGTFDILLSLNGRGFQTYEPVTRPCGVGNRMGNQCRLIAR